MRIPKPKMSGKRKLQEVDVELRWNCRPQPHFVPKKIFYPLFDPGDPEQPAEVVEYEIDKVLDDRDCADMDLGVSGRLFVVDIIANENSTVRTVLWFDEEKFMVEAKINHQSS